MKTEKTILHCDLNNFFASVECLKYPQLKGYPVAVCGNIENRHGIVLAKNDVAKSYGIKTAEVVWEAKQKCPNLVLLTPHMEEYVAMSKKVREIYSEYTDLIEPFGIDECWLDVTGSSLLFGDGETIAYKIKEQVKKETGLTISVGVSFTKIFAKLGSDMKKPDAVTVISTKNYKDKIWNLNASDLIGIGKATYHELLKYGIKTIGDLANCDEKFLQSKLGKNGRDLHLTANGLGDSEVHHQDYSEEAKSIGNSITCKADLEKSEEAFKLFFELSESVCAKLREERLLPSGIQITVKAFDLTVKEFQSSLTFPTRHPKEICLAAMALFEKNYTTKKDDICLFEKPVRMLGIRTFHFVSDNQSTQCSMLCDPQKENELEQLEQKIDDLRKRFGTDSISRARLIDKPSLK